MNTPEVAVAARTKSGETPISPKNRRPTRRRTHDRLTISVPVEVGARLRAEAEAAGAPSLSAYIVDALDQRVEKQTFRDILDEMFREDPMTDEEREWADRILDR